MTYEAELLKKYDIDESTPAPTSAAVRAAPVRPTDPLVAKYDIDAETAVQNTVSATRFSPEDAAKVHRLARESGISPWAVEGNEAQVAADIVTARSRELLRKDPFLATVVAGNPAFADVAQKDMENAAAITKAWQEGGFDPASRAARKRDDAFVKGVAAQPTGRVQPMERSGLLPELGTAVARGAARAAVSKTLIASELGLYDSAPVERAAQLRQELRRAGALAMPDEVAASLAEIKAAESFTDALSAVVRNPRAAVEVSVESLAASSPRILAALAGSVAGPWGTAAGGGVGSFAVEYASTLAGVVEDATSAAEIQAALSDPTKMAAARKKAVTRGVAIAVFDALTAGIAGKLLAGAKPTIGSAATRSTGEISIQAAGGAAGEAAAGAAVGEFNWGDVLLEAFAELPTALTEVPSNIGHYRHAVQQAQAETDAANLTQLLKLATESQAAKLDKPTFNAFFQSVAADASATIASEKLTEILATSNLDMATVLPTTAAQIARGEVVGTEVEVPIAELVTGLAGTGAEAEVIRHLRLDPDAMTLAEAQEPGEKAAEFFQQETERILEKEASNEEFIAGQKQVHDDMLEQLTQAGTYRSSVNRAFAKHAANMYSVLAERAGVTPRQLRDGWTDAKGVAHRGYKLSIFGAEGAPTGTDTLDQGFAHGQAMLNVGPKLGSFNPATLEMRLLADANLSTFQHETAHFFLTVYTDLASQPDAPQAIKDDVATLMKWFGVADVATWNAMSLEQQRPYHEQFAESFEQYLFSGKAPNTELQSLYARFASWLKKVYGSLQEFIATHTGAKLNPEVQAVMDRMVATEAQIAEANAAREYSAIFKDAAEAGMTDTQFAAYMALDDAQREDAEAMLRSRSLRDTKWARTMHNKVIAALQADSREKRAEMLDAVKKELAATPLRRAMRWLKRGEVTTDAGDEVKALVGHRLQIAAVEALFPEGALTPRPDLSKLGYGQYGMLAAEGQSPDVVAEMFGFSSGEALVRELIAAPKFSEEAEALTDQRMLEEYGDLSSPEAMARAADEAIHNDFRTRAVATELAALGKNIGTPATLAKAAKEYARRVIEQRTAKTLKPWAFAAAETRAGKDALRALRTGDREAAAAAKRTELVNHIGAKEAYAAEKELKAIVDRFKKIAGYSEDSSAIKTRNAELVAATRAVLAEFGIGEAKGKRAREYLEVVAQHNPDLAEVLADTINAVTDNAKDWRELKLVELRSLAEDIDQIWFLAKRSKQIEIDGKMVPLTEAQNALYARLDEIGIPDRVPGEGQAVTASEKRGMMFDRFVGALRRMESWVGAKDGASVGAFHSYVWNPIKDAANAYRADKAKYLKAYRDMLDGIAPTLTRQLIEAPEIGYVFGKDEAGMGKAELLHAILHTGNASNKRKLLLGRGWATEAADGTLDTTKWDAFVKRMHDTGVLTKADYDFAQGTWNLLDSMKPLAQKAHRAVFGKYFAEITADKFVTPFGEYAGGYVPAVADPLIVRDADLNKLREGEEANMTYAFPTTAKGFTKSRVEYNRPLRLNLGSMTQHIDKVLLFSHMTQPVNDVRRVLTGKGVSQALGRVDPQAFNAVIIPWLNRAAKQVVETQAPGREGLGRFWSVVRARAGMAAMFANVANSVQQITGLSLAAVRVRPPLLLDAIAQFTMSPKATSKFVTSKSVYMTTRIENEVSALSGQIDEILLNPSVYQNAKAWTNKHGYFLQSAVDSVISPVVWLAAYNQAIEQGQDDADAVRTADATVRETQGSQQAEDVANFETGSAFYRMFVQFAGYFNMNANLLGTEFVKITRDMGLRKGAGRGLYVFTFGLLAPAIVGEIIMQIFKGGPDDDDKDGEYLDDWLKTTFGWAPLRYVTAMAPGFGTVVNAGVNMLNNKPYDDRISTAPAISMIESAVKAPISVYKAAVEDGKPSRAIKDVATAVSIGLGLPASGIARPVSYLADVAADRVEPTSTVDLVRGTMTGTARPASKQ